MVVKRKYKYTMRARARVLVLLAIAATAAARPSDDVQTPPTTRAAPSTTALTTLPPTTVKPHDDHEALQQQNEMAPEKPVNERYPSAVLYGRTCGGTIISPTWIITAAHCTLFSVSSTVLAGTNKSLDGSGVTVRVKRLVLHPRFSVGPYWVNPDEFGIKQVAARFDFLLAELEKPLPLDGKKIAAAKLDDDLKTPVGLDVGYAGYGAKHHGQTMRHNMHAMELSVLPDDTCARKLEQYDAQDMLCAKGRPPRFDSACNGDSGSGLISEGRLLGIVSWVENDAVDCAPGSAVVFSRVARVREWIRQVTGV